MQDISIGKDALKHLKAHDNFLTDLKLGVAFDQDVLKKEIDDKIVLTQIINKAVGEIQNRKEYISGLEAELSGYRMMEEEYSSLKLRHEDGVVRCNDLEGDVIDLQAKAKESLEEIGQLSKNLELVNKKRSELQSFVDEMIPKYESLGSEHNAMKQEYENKIGKLEDQLNSALHREEIFKEKWKRSDEDGEKYRSEADARGLQIEYLQSKLEEKYHVETMFSQLKEDYEELRKEKQGLYDQMETRLVQKEEEIKKINMERDDREHKVREGAGGQGHGAGGAARGAGGEAGAAERVGRRAAEAGESGEAEAVADRVGRANKFFLERDKPDEQEDPGLRGADGEADRGEPEDEDKAGRVREEGPLLQAPDARGLEDTPRHPGQEVLRNREARLHHRELLRPLILVLN